MKRCARRPVLLPPRSAFAGFRFASEVIVVAIRGYLRYGLSHRDGEELLAERAVLDELVPSARQHFERYANNPIESAYWPTA